MATWAERMRKRQADMTEVPPGTGTPDGRDVVRGEAPVMDMRTPTFNAYRGQEDHGVPAAVVPPDLSPPPNWTPPEWDPPAPDIEPLPVRVVTQSTDEYRAFRTFSYQVSNPEVSRILPRDRSRRKVTIYNNDGQPSLVGADSSLTVYNGYPLFVGGAPLVLETTEPIYVISLSPGTYSQLRILTEYTVNPLDQNVGMDRG